MNPVRIIKELFRQNTDVAPDYRGLFKSLKRKWWPKETIPNRFLSIFINRYCNLKCFSCGALGMNPEPDETTLKEIYAFLDKIKSYKPNSTIMLTGGEPTMVKEEKLASICWRIRGHGYKTALLTNGFRMTLELSKLFDYIVLDDHGVNSAKIRDLRRVLEPTGKLVSVVAKSYHQDTEYAMKDNITKGARCSNWMKPLTLWKNVVYPCCNIMCVEWWNNTDYVTHALFNAGWHVDNPALLETITNWRFSLPAEFYRMCSLACWKDASKARWKKIEVSKK